MKSFIDDKLTLFCKKIENTSTMETNLGDIFMQDEHIEKLTEERNDLLIKIERLKKFMKSDKFKALDDMNQQLLSLQKTQMKALLKTLDLRIDWEN